MDTNQVVRTVTSEQAASTRKKVRYIASSSVDISNCTSHNSYISSLGISSLLHLVHQPKAHECEGLRQKNAANHNVAIGTGEEQQRLEHVISRIWIHGVLQFRRLVLKSPH